MIGRHRGRLRTAALVAALGLVLVACAGDDDGGGEAAEEATIEMTDALKFSPQQVTIEVGGTVTWENPSTVVHTATADPDAVADPDNVSVPDGAEPWDSGFVQPGDSFSHAFTEPGTYEYICIPHEGVGMAGTIVVEA